MRELPLRQLLAKKKGDLETFAAENNALKEYIRVLEKKLLDEKNLEMLQTTGKGDSKSKRGKSRSGTRGKRSN